MVSIVESSSSNKEMVDSALKNQNEDHSHEECAPDESGQPTVLFTQDIDNNSLSGLQRQEFDGSINVRSCTKVEGEQQQEQQQQQQQQQSATTLHQSINSVESIDLLDMSNDEASEEEAVVDRRVELVRQRSSRRRLGELSRAFFDVDPTSSSIEPSSHREFSNRYSSDDESSSNSSKVIIENNNKEWNAGHHDTTEAELYTMAQTFLRAVVGLQARTRRFCAYRKFQRIVKATRHIQVWIRTRVQKEHQMRLTIQTISAVKVQALARGFLARRAYHRLVNYVENHLAALIIQKWWQLVCLDPKEYKAASRIQALFRGYTTKEFFVLQRFAATLIQAHLRGRQKRRQYERMRNGSGSTRGKINQRNRTLVDLEASTHSGDSKESTDLVDDPYDREDELSMPPLEDMEAPSESNYASSEPSDCSSTVSEVNSTQITVKMSNTATRQRREDTSKVSHNELRAVKETVVRPIENSEKASLVTPHKARNLPGVHGSMTARCISVTPLQPSPPIDSPPVAPRLEAENEPVFEEEAARKRSTPAMDISSSEDIFPPSPAKTEVDFDDDLDDTFQDPFENRTNSSSIFMILLIVTCFVLPVVLFFDELPQGFVGSKITVRKTNTVKISSEMMTPVPSKQERQIPEQPNIRIEKPEIKMDGKIMIVPMERQKSPPKSSPSHTVPKTPDTNRPAMVNQPKPPSRGAPSRGGSIPITTIHIPISDAIHSTVISKREKELSRAVSHLNFEALGQWTKNLHGRIFKNRADGPTNVEVLRWSQIDGSAVFLMDRSRVTESVSALREKDYGHTIPSTKVEVMRRSQTDGHIVSSMNGNTVTKSVSVPPKKDGRETIPLPHIYLSSFGSFHAAEIGKREKAISRRDTHLINVRAVGNWAKSIRQRFFEASAAESTQVDVAGWLEIDGRGLFVNQLELSQSRTVDWVKNAIVLKEDDIKVAKNADLSLVTEWGLAVTSIRKKK